MTNFMQEDEFLILMNHCKYRAMDTLDDPYHILTTEERARLYDAGIRTAHEQPAWNYINPSKNTYDFSYLDEIIEMNRNAGLKSLVQISGWKPPKWLPDEWFAQQENGTVERECLSFWNEEAQEFSDNFYKFMADCYKDDKDVQFFFGEWQGGEGAIRPTWPLFDHAALENYKNIYGSLARPQPNDPETMKWFGDKIIQHFVRKAEILYPYWHEMWNAQQYLMDTWNKAFGNFVQKDILIKYRELHPEASIVLLQYTYFDSAHHEDNEQYVDMLREVSGCEVIAEAMFCGGLAMTTPKSIAKGFRGQIVHPQKDGFSNGNLEPWMIDEIRKSNDMWKAMKYENNSLH